MAMHSLQLDYPAVDIALSSSGSRIAVVSNRDLAVYTWDLAERPLPKPILLWRSQFTDNHWPRHVAFTAEDDIYALTDSWDEDESCIWRSQRDIMTMQGPILEAESVSSLFSNVEGNALHVQLRNGALHHLKNQADAENMRLQTSLVHKFPTFASEVRVVRHENQVWVQVRITGYQADLTRLLLLV